MDFQNRGAADFGQYAKALLVGRGDLIQAAAYADTRSVRAHAVLKAAVAAGGTSDPAWAGSLVDHQIMADGFLESLRSISAYDTVLPFTRRVPLETRVAVVTVGASGAVVGPGVMKPVSRLQLSGPMLTAKKASCFLVMTNELARNASAEANALLAKELRGGVAAATNAEFLGGLIDASGSNAFVSSGDSATLFLADLGAMLAGVSLTGASKLFLVVTPSAAAALSVLIASNGSLAFPEMSPNGGAIAGISVLVSDALPTDSTGSTALLVDASAIVAGSETVTLASSSVASLQMDDNPAEGPQSLTSLFQTNSVALRAERFFGFEVIRPSGVAVLTGLNPGVIAP